MNNPNFKPSRAGLVTLGHAKRPFSLWRLSVNTRFALLFFFLGLAGQEFAKSSPPATEITLDLDRPACKIEFSLGATLHTVHGVFAIKEGSMLRLDVVSGEISGRIVVDVRSGKTGDGERDRRMHQDVLESEQFPDAIFRPNRLSGKLTLAGESEVGVQGVLRIHGKDHGVTLAAKISVEKGHFVATSHLSIPYVKWGMRDPSTMILRVSKTVELEMRVVGTIRQESW